MSKPTHKKGSVFGRWALTENLGVGGNGEVWRVLNDRGETRVMKLLRPGDERYKRFKQEIATVKSLVPTGFPALPIEETHLPERPSKVEPAYYVMPEAVPILIALATKPIPDRVDAFRQLAEALATLLSEHGQSHRDVKPSNLYEHEGRAKLGDFGLITNPDPEAESLTTDGTVVGPWAFLPSEVFNPLPGTRIDWEKVDVHCLAMSLWCAVKGSKDPPRRIKPNGVMSLKRQLQIPSPTTDPSDREDANTAELRQQIGELDAIPAAATAGEPSERPTLSRFAQQLGDWKEGIRIRDEFRSAVSQSQADRELVLRWLVTTARQDRSLSLNVIDVAEPMNSSPVASLNCGRFSAALDDLVETYEVVGKRFPERGDPRHWENVYPTSFGIDRVEQERVQVETLPLLRTLLQIGQLDILELAGSDDSVAFGEALMPSPELCFLLRYLRESNLVDFDLQWSGGPTAILLHLKLTGLGRVRAAGLPA
jgi:serine/threonine protein kinase